MVTPDGERWEINCSQLCGALHYRMRGFCRSLSAEAYAAFVAVNSGTAAGRQ